MTSYYLFDKRVVMMMLAEGEESLIEVWLIRQFPTLQVTLASLSTDISRDVSPNPTLECSWLAFVIT